MYPTVYPVPELNIGSDVLLLMDMLMTTSVRMVKMMAVMMRITAMMGTMMMMTAMMRTVIRTMIRGDDADDNDDGDDA